MEHFNTLMIKVTLEVLKTLSFTLKEMVKFNSRTRREIEALTEEVNVS